MKVKSKISICILGIIFVLLVFLSLITHDGRYSLLTCFYAFSIIPAIIIVYLIEKFIKIPKNKLINNFKSQNRIIQFLAILFVSGLLFELVTTHNVGVITAVLILTFNLAYFLDWFFKKPEDLSYNN